MKPRALGVVAPRSPIPAPPPDRGQLFYDNEIADAFFKGLPGIKDKTGWVRRHLPRSKRLKIGASSAWYEREINEWIESGMKKESEAA